MVCPGSRGTRRLLQAIPRRDGRGRSEVARTDGPQGAENAIWALSDAANSYYVNNNAELGTAIEKLVQAWKDAFKTNFLDKYYDDLRNFDQGQWNEWRKSLSRWNGLLSADQKRRKNELDEEALKKFTAEANDLAGVFEALGDKYVAGTCYYWAGASLDPDQNTKSPDPAKAIEYYKKALKFRDDLDHKDSWYTDLTSLVAKMELELKKGPVAKKPADKKPGQPGAPGNGGGPAALGGGELFAKDSKWVPAVSKIRRGPSRGGRAPFLVQRRLLHGLAQHWTPSESPRRSPSKPSSRSSRFPRKRSSFARRKPSMRSIRATRRRSPSSSGAPRRSSSRFLTFRRSTSFMAAMGSNQEAIHGTTVNVSADDNYAQIYYTPAASRSAVDVAGQKVRVFDDNGDGKMGSDPLMLKDFGQRMEGRSP